MKLLKNKYVFLLLFLIFVTSCNLTKRITKPKHKTLSLIDSVERHLPVYNSVEYRFYAVYKDSQQNYSLTGSFVNYKDSLIYISVSPGFGLKVAQIISKPDSTLIYLPLQRSYIFDDNKIFIKKYNLAFDFYSLQSLFTGYFFPYPYFKQLSDYQQDIDDNFIFLNLKNLRNKSITDVHHKVFFNDNYSLDSVAIIDFVLKDEVYAKYDNFTKYDNISIPSTLKVTYIAYDTAKISIKIKNVKVNSNPQINFKLPKNAKRVTY